MGLSVSFLTFGCKLNQVETEALREAFSASGARLLPSDSPEGIDLIVINTCTVTAQAEARARRALRLVREAQPACLALITGCWAELAGQEESSLGDGVYVLPGSRKAELLDVPAWLARQGGGEGGLAASLEAWLAQGPGGSSPGRFSYMPSRFILHSRPSLKVQDGCDNRCTYCRVSLARGPSVSLEPGLVLERLQALESSGAAEAVLTGVNLSQYRSGELNFSGLLSFLLSKTSSIALRLSSWEPDRVDEAFLEIFAQARIRSHLHLAIQSGSSPILSAMGRAYTRGHLLQVVAQLRRAKGDPFIGADLMVGFPGEGEAEFQDTLDLVAEADLAHVQGFVFSPRPGTPAAGFAGQVDPGLAEARRARLAQASTLARQAYVGRWLGKTVETVVEGRDILVQGSAWRRATSGNYLRLAIPASQAPARGRSQVYTIAPASPPSGFDALGILPSGSSIPG